MARPRKDSREPGARERIITALWHLLEDMSFHEIGIKAIVAEAKCNRATFYYHFESAQDLFEKAIVEEIASPDGIPWLSHVLLSGRSFSSQLSERLGLSMHRLNLAMHGGGMDAVQRIVVLRMMAVWADILGCKEGELTEGSKMIIRYGVCGTLGFLFFPGDEKELSFDEIPWGFAADAASRLARGVCQEQGVPLEEVKQRMASFEAGNVLSREP